MRAGFVSRLAAFFVDAVVVSVALRATAPRVTQALFHVFINTDFKFGPVYIEIQLEIALGDFCLRFSQCIERFFRHILLNPGSLQLLVQRFQCFRGNYTRRFQRFLDISPRPFNRFAALGGTFQ